MENVSLNINGMSCGHCVKAVENALTDLGNIQNIEVSLEEKKATFQYDSSKISLEAIKAEIIDCGYEVV